MASSKASAFRLRNKTADYIRGTKRDEEFTEPQIPVPSPTSLDLVHTVSRTSTQAPTPSPGSSKTRLSLSFLTRTRKKSQNAPPPPGTRPSLGINTNVGLDANQPVLDISPVDVVTPTVATPRESPAELKPSTSTSFTSRFSRFSPLKTRRPQRESEDASSLHVPHSASQVAFDSVSSSNSSSYVPVTPRVASQPTITVSHPDNNLVEEYRDIFTYAPLGRPNSIHNGAVVQIDAKSSQRQRTLSSKSADPRPLSRSRSTARPDAEQLSKGRVTNKRDSDSVSLGRQGSVRSMGSIPSPPESPPPPIPLPATPSSLQSFSTPAAAYAARAMRSSPTSPEVPRRRANTLSSSGSVSPPPKMLRKVASTPLDRLLQHKSISKESLEVANPDQLKSMVQAGNSRFEELAAYLMTLVEIHTAEKTSLERRIALLESEAKKKEKEMKGLRWLLTTEVQPASPTTSSGSTLDPGSASIASGGRRMRRKQVGNTFESDSESMSRTSGFETSNTTDSNHIYIKHRRRQLGSHIRTDSNGLGLELPNGNAPYLVPATKRSSVSSYASSPSSSTSSLGLHLPANLHSHGLSAIPEAPSTPLPHQETTPMPTAQKELPAVSVSNPSGASSDNEDLAASVAYAANLKRHKHASIEQVLCQSSEVELNSALKKLRRLNDASSPSL